MDYLTDEQMTELSIGEVTKAFENGLNGKKHGDYVQISSGAGDVWTFEGDSFITKPMIRSFLNWVADKQETDSQLEAESLRERIVELTESRDKIQNAADRLFVELFVLKDKIDALEADAKSRKEHTLRLEAKLHEAGSGVMSRQIDILKSQLRSAETRKAADRIRDSEEIAKLKHHQDGLDCSIVDLEAWLDEARAEAASWKANSDILNRTVDGLKDNIARLKAQIADADNIGEKRLSTALKLEAERDEARARLAGLSALNVELQCERRKLEEGAKYWFTNFNETVAEKAEKVDALKKEHDLLRQSFNDWEKGRLEVVEQRNKLQGQIYDQSAVITRLRGEAFALTKDLAEAREQIAYWKTAHGGATKCVTQTGAASLLELNAKVCALCKERDIALAKADAAENKWSGAKRLYETTYKKFSMVHDLCNDFFEDGEEKEDGSC